MIRRRALFALLVGATAGALLLLIAHALSAGGLDPLDWAMIAAFAVTLPWTVVGFWNAVIGLALMRIMRDPLGAVLPAHLAAADESPIVSRTAVLVCIRNEDPALLRRNLEAMLAGLVAAGAAPHLQVFLLSDTDRPAVAAEEEGVAARLAESFGPSLAVTYRRRPCNTGFKAGNIRDFCDRWGAEFDFALVLDADSVMMPAVMLRLIRAMQADGGIGILQTLVVGMPSSSPFARIFQFGMRLGMRSYTLGSAFWQGDCGPYWGHNAIIRLAPFMAHCRLPVLPGRGPLAGPILSHDQAEAVLMRRAGFEVRVLPLETGSWEENPPTLLEFIRRDLRWCQGNMQYARLLFLPGLQVVSRCQLAMAMLMFLASPAWLVLVLLVAARGLAGAGADPVFRPEVGLLLFATVMTMVFAPKIASVLDVLSTRGGARRFGGTSQFLASVTVEILFSMILAPIMAVAHSVFLAGLACGRTIGWTAPVREDHRVPLRAAVARLWVQGAVGLGLLSWFTLVTPPVNALFFLPFYGPLLLAVAFAAVTAQPRLGLILARRRIAAIPEEVAPPPELLRLNLPALMAGQPVRRRLKAPARA